MPEREKRVREVLAAVADLENQARGIAAGVYSIRNNGASIPGSIDNIETEGETIIASWDEMCRGSYQGRYSIEFPLSYLWLDDPLKLEREAEDARRLERQRAERAKQEATDADRLARDRAMYERLRERFESETART